MPRTARHSKNEIVARLFRVFQECGYEGASLKALADAADLSKASLYHHFPMGKEQMAAAVLAKAGVDLQRHVFNPLQVTGDSAVYAKALKQSLEGVLQYYQGAVPICLMNGLTMGAGGALYGKAIAEAVEAWRLSYQTCFEAVSGDVSEARAWSHYAIERIQGALIICRVTASREPLENCIRELTGDIDGL